ncbi:MAG: DNA topoisomerase I [Nanoarchaeota archaeon]
MSSYELLISEKPDAALKIATALADDKPVKKLNKKVPYYEISHKGKKLIVGCAVGHLFGLKETDGKGWVYPITNYDWVPIYEVNKFAKYTKDYINTFKKLVKEAKEFTICTDFDDEGSLLGYNVLRFIAKKNDAHRMKFSTLTKKDLIVSYENRLKTLDFGQIYAGETRHNLDFLWGINLSRALTLSMKKASGGFKVLSIGRIQGPTLNLIVEKEKEILAFKPVSYWQISLTGLVDKKEIIAWHKTNEFWKKEEAGKVLKDVKGKKAIVQNIKESELTHEAPFPFDLTTLQIEAYRNFGINPKESLAIAQSLYVNGLISYPRTSSQQIPDSIDIKEIFTKLLDSKYKSLVKELLKTKLIPNNGKKTDPAHPAIIITGELPEKLKERELKVYDLIAKRTFATYGEPAKRKSLSVEINCNKESFIAKGILTTYPGWHKYYSPYVKLDEIELPKLEKGQEILKPKFEMYEKETQPPRRYSPASLVKELESRHLGTKATRSNIIETLYDRQYIMEQSIQATELGIRTIETLEKYSPEIIDEKLTREFEEETELIQEGKKTEEEIVEKNKIILLKILEKFKKHELDIGKELAEANIETRNKASIIGKCHKCKVGDLRILYNKRFKSYFVACNKYPDCKTTFSMPKYALPKPGDICKECTYPRLKMIRQGKRPYDFCINLECPSRKRYLEEHKKLDENNKTK